MIKMRFVLATAALAFVVTLTYQTRAEAETAPSEPKNAEEVFDRYLKAVGGADAVKAIKSRVTKAETQLDPYNVTGKVETLQKAGNRYFEDFSLENVGSFHRGYDGKTGWSKSPFDGIKDLTGLSLASAKEEAELQLPARMKEVFAGAKLKGKEKKQNAEVYVVEFPGKDKPAEAYFDVKTGLLVGGKKEVDTQNGVQMEERTLGDYRTVDGVKIPFSIKKSAGEMTATTKVLEVKHNVEIADSKFAKPAE